MSRTSRLSEKSRLATGSKTACAAKGYARLTLKLAAIPTFAGMTKILQFSLDKVVIECFRGL